VKRSVLTSSEKLDGRVGFVVLDVVVWMLFVNVIPPQMYVVKNSVARIAVFFSDDLTSPVLSGHHIR